MKNNKQTAFSLKENRNYDDNILFLYLRGKIRLVNVISQLLTSHFHTKKKLFDYIQNQYVSLFLA